MAKINPVKVKKDADKEEKAGRLDKAISLYQQLLQVNARDWNTINKVGDLYARMGKNREASAQYAKVAEFYAADGFLLKAIAIWKKINRLDASALEPYLKRADLYAKQGLMMEAKSQYQIVVDEYIKRGKARDAGDVLQKMADIDPGDLKIRSRLADLYMRAGQKGKAIDEHIAIAEQLNLKGHLPEAVQVLQKGLKIDARNGKLMLELARLHLVQNDYSEAVGYLEQVSEGAPDDTDVLTQLGDAYLGSGRIPDAERVFQRLVDLEPENENHRTQMGRLHIAKNDLDRALDEFGPVIDAMLERQDGMSANFLLQEVLEKDAQHVKTLVKLVEVNRALGNDDQAASTYQELTEAYIKQAQWEQAASVLEILVGMDPDNQQHSSKLEFVRKKLGGGEPEAVSEPEPSIDLDDGLPDFDAIGDSGGFGDLDSLGGPESPVVEPVAPEPLSAPPVAVSGGSIELGEPLGEEDKEFIEEHLAEGRVFRKYGLIDKALDQFDAVIARFPDNIETRLELKEVFEEKGEKQKAGQECLTIAEIHRLKGDEDAALEILEQARELAPELVPDVVSVEPESEPVLEASPEPEPSLEPDLGLDLEPEPALEPEPDFGMDLGGEEDEDIPLDLGEPEATPEPSFDPEPPTPLGVEEPIAEPSSGLDLDLDLAVPAPLQVEPEQSAAAVEVSPAVQKVLDEVDSFVSLGFVDDAKDALLKANAQFPGDAAMAEKMEELGVEEGDALPEPPPAPDLSADNPLGDLGAEPEPSHPAPPRVRPGQFRRWHGRPRKRSRRHLRRPVCDRRGGPADGWGLE